MIPNPPTLIIEPPARKPKGRKKKNGKLHYYTGGQCLTFVNLADARGYFESLLALSKEAR